MTERRIFSEKFPQSLHTKDGLELTQIPAAQYFLPFSVKLCPAALRAGFELRLSRYPKDGGVADGAFIQKSASTSPLSYSAYIPFFVLCGSLL